VGITFLERLPKEEEFEAGIRVFPTQALELSDPALRIGVKRLMVS